MILYHGSNCEFKTVSLKESKNNRDFGKGFYTKSFEGNKMECLKDKYIYKGKDISFLVVRKIEQIVSLIAEKENKSFEEAYSDFLNSQIYKVLQNTNSLMWFENAEFIVEEYNCKSKTPEITHSR